MTQLSKHYYCRIPGPPHFRDPFVSLSSYSFQIWNLKTSPPWKSILCFQSSSPITSNPSKSFDFLWNIKLYENGLVPSRTRRNLSKSRFPVGCILRCRSDNMALIFLGFIFLILFPSISRSTVTHTIKRSTTMATPRNSSRSGKLHFILFSYSISYYVHNC